MDLPQQPHEQLTTPWYQRPIITLAQWDLEKTAYLIILILGVLSRFYLLGDRVVSHDESLHTQYSYQYYNGDGYQHSPLMHGPMLFHVTAVSYWLFGDNDYSARVPVAILGLILVLVFPYLLRPWIGRVGALLMSFLLLISPYITYYSRYIREDLYVIIGAMILFVAMLSYWRAPREHHLTWLAVGIAIVFSTKEVSFMYVAVFGSFLVLRLLAKLLNETAGIGTIFPLIRIPLLLLIAGLLLFGAGYYITHRTFIPNITPSAETTTSAETTPVEQPIIVTGPLKVVSELITPLGLIIVVAAIIIALKNLRAHLQAFPEFDLTMIYGALCLPLTSAAVIHVLGRNPMDQSFFWNQSLSRLENLSLLFRSDIFYSVITLFALIGIGLWLGFWWGGSRFVRPLIAFYAIFLLLYSSLFTNTAAGFYSGMVGQLGYWLEQHEVQRGNQPWYYYFFATTFYEFFLIIFSWAAMRAWFKQRHLLTIVGYWGGLLLGAGLAYSFVGWLSARSVPLSGLNTNSYLLLAAIIIGWIVLRWYITQSTLYLWHWLEKLFGILLFVALLVIAATFPFSQSSPLPGWAQWGAVVMVLLGGAIYWFLIGRKTPELHNVAWREVLAPERSADFISLTIWWYFLTWFFYTWAGEKMPWLSTHFVPPMAFLTGWYLNQQLHGFHWEALRRWQWWAKLGNVLAIFVTLFYIFQLLLIKIEWGVQTTSNLNNQGALFGRIALLIGLILLYNYLQQQENEIPEEKPYQLWMFSAFILLSLVTIRATYIANFINYDLTNEYLVYAHGAPGTKKQVIAQIEQLSLRLHGDHSIDVRFDNDSSWPMYWYMRIFPNNKFFGENPDASLLEAEAIVAGNDNWSKVDQIVRDQFEYQTHAYLWWPMEEYRNINWTSVMGINGSAETPRGLGARSVREGLWNIFFYRDYKAYGDVFNINYERGQWPLRDDLRLYLRKDLLAKVWDKGALGIPYTPPVDPYAEGELTLTATQAIGQGQLNRPRNLVVADDGRIFVADSGNHQIKLFSADGTLLQTIGSQGEAQGQLNEPWGITILGEHLFVADTWNFRIVKYTLDGELVATYGTGGNPTDGVGGELLFFGPRDLAVSADGNLLITDTGNHRVQVMTPDGVFVTQFGKQGFELAQFSEPTSLDVSANGTLYIAEAWARRVQRFSADYLPIDTFNVSAWKGNSIDNKPYIALDRSDRVFISDPEGNQIIFFDAVGQYLGRFGRFGSDLSTFNLPTGIAFDDEDNLYIADTNNNRILKFAPITP